MGKSKTSLRKKRYNELRWRRKGQIEPPSHKAYRSSQMAEYDKLQDIRCEAPEQERPRKRTTESQYNTPGKKKRKAVGLSQADDQHISEVDSHVESEAEAESEAESEAEANADAEAEEEARNRYTTDDPEESSTEHNSGISRHDMLIILLACALYVKYNLTFLYA
jgi:hypothetical protein